MSILFENLGGNVFKLSPINEALEWKDVPEEEKHKAHELINAHNDATDPEEKGAYLIDVTGKHQVYYTLWLYKEVDPRIAAWIKNPTYMGNLTTNLLSSVQLTLSKPGVQNKKVILLTDETKQNLIGKTQNTPTFTFGKYRGRIMAEVFLEDPGYFIFLAKNAVPKYANSPSNLVIQHFAQVAYQDITKKNQETSTSQFVGNVGDKYSGELEVYKIDQKTGDFGPYTVNKLKDANENKFMVFNLEKNFPDVAVGNKINLKGKVKAHKEFVGVKFTLLNYVKPS
jgi:uncharacterized protein (DUF3820 family)